VHAYFCMPPTSLARRVPWHCTLLRVFTGALGHHGFQHLLGNMISLIDNGPACEGQLEGEGALGVFCTVAWCQPSPLALAAARYSTKGLAVMILIEMAVGGEPRVPPCKRCTWNHMQGRLTIVTPVRQDWCISDGEENAGLAGRVVSRT
jgi:hypothetical protein